MALAIPLSQIQKEDQESRKQLIRQLSTQGFALIELEIGQRTHALDWGIEEAKNLTGFRFPPINVDSITYDEVHREVFKALYLTAIDCLSLLTQQAEWDLAQVDKLFSESLHEPFPLEHAYHPTFFNLFNYDHGALNAHQDRGLITIIHAVPPSTKPEEASAIWIEGPEQVWRSGGALIRQAMKAHPNKRFVLLLVGEEGELLFKAQGLDLYAAEHSVRVRPDGDFIDYSHYQRDPESRASSNRLSAALILKRDLDR